MIISVFSDASLGSANNAGWAAWVKASGRTLCFSAGITWPVQHISEAETVAIASAILRAIDEFDPMGECEDDDAYIDKRIPGGFVDDEEGRIRSEKAMEDLHDENRGA